MIDNSLVDTSDNGVGNLKLDAIEDVKIIITSTTKYYNGYRERPSSYVVKLKGESRWRRVYLTPIGNVSVCYIKSEGSYYYCEAALEEARMRQDEGDAVQLPYT